MDKMAGKVRAKDKEERNSLHSACKDGRIDLVKQLIQSGTGIQVYFFTSFISAIFSRCLKSDFDMLHPSPYFYVLQNYNVKIA